jgi:hypothetical protein
MNRPERAFGMHLKHPGTVGWPSCGAGEVREMSHSCR